MKDSTGDLGQLPEGYQSFIEYLNGAIRAVGPLEVHVLKGKPVPRHSWYFYPSGGLRPVERA